MVLGELADVLPVLGLVHLDDGSLVVSLVLALAVLLFLLSELAVKPVDVLQVDVDVGQELEGSLVVALEDASCELAGCEPLGSSCASPRSFECL